jgi:hypothetical protein
MTTLSAGCIEELAGPRIHIENIHLLIIFNTAGKKLAKVYELYSDFVSNGLSCLKFHIFILKFPEKYYNSLQ